jgi:hypothetical protein
MNQTSQNAFLDFLQLCGFVRSMRPLIRSDRKYYQYEFEGKHFFRFQYHVVVFDSEFNYVETKPTGETSFVLDETDIGIPPEKRQSVRVEIVGDSQYLYVKPEGHGEPEYDSGGAPVQMALRSGQLVLIVHPDINDCQENATEISLEKARKK